MRAWIIAVLGVLAAPINGAAASAPPLAFNGIELGTTREAWLALKTPVSASPHARRACSGEPGAVEAGLSARGLPKGAVVCAIVDTYGAIRLPVSFTWNRRYRMDNVRYLFQGGRLAEIRAALPADAFDAVEADFRRSYGAPIRNIRDSVNSEIGRLPRATLQWVTQEGEIEVVSPSTPGKLSVRVAMRQAKGREPQAAMRALKTPSGSRPARVGWMKK